MILWTIPPWFILSYVIIYFVISRTVIPFMGFRKEPLPRNLPRVVKRDIERLKNASSTKEEFLRNAFDHLTARFQARKLQSLAHLQRVLDPDVFARYSRRGYIFCTQISHLMRIFLVTSGFFRDRDIKTRVQFRRWGVHQYLLVRLNGKWVPVDTWLGTYIGDPIGTRAAPFFFIPNKQVSLS